MRRVQLLIDEATDDALQRAALRLGRSKSDLARETLAERFRPLPPIEKDSIWKLQGSADFEPVEDIDEFLYG